MAVIDIIKEKAKADKKTIVLPESMDRRTWEAAEKILKEGLANLIIIGTPEDIGEHSKGLDVSGATIINPQTYEKTQEYIDLFVELRKAKGMTPEKAKETILGDYAYYGCLMIKNGDAAGMVEISFGIKSDCWFIALSLLPDSFLSVPFSNIVAGVAAISSVIEAACKFSVLDVSSGSVCFTLPKSGSISGASPKSGSGSGISGSAKDSMSGKSDGGSGMTGSLL